MKYSIHRIIKENQTSFFDKSELPHFGRTIIQPSYDGKGGVFFVSSEKGSAKLPRVFSINIFTTIEKRVRPTGMYYRSKLEAQKIAKRLSIGK